MGRKLISSAALAVATFGVFAGSAVAKGLEPSFSNGTQLTAKQQKVVHSRMRAVDGAAAPPSGTSSKGSAIVLNSGKFEECTVPEGMHKFQNFFTTDTTNYFDGVGSTVTGFGVVIGTCTADLHNKQTSATSTDQPSGKKLIPFPGTYKTYSEACNVIYDGQNFNGDAESIVYPSGIFEETCVVPVSF